MSDIENDIDHWAREHLFTWAKDVLMRCEIAGIENRATGIIASLTVEIAARTISSSTMDPTNAGKMFAEAIEESRKIKMGR